MTALALGVGVERHPSLGHITPSLQPRALTLYAEQLRHLEHALILTWAPKSHQNHTLKRLKRLGFHAAVMVGHAPVLWGAWVV